MTIRKLIALIVAGMLALAACSDGTMDDVASELEDAADVSVADETEQDAMELASEVEDQMNTLQAEVQSSEAVDDLEESWNQVESELTAAIASMGTDGTISTEGLEEELDDFQTAIEDAGDSITPELRDAWQSLRTQVEELMS